jgi:pimeloyl-ACP methyl ester carboxylesterase
MSRVFVPGFAALPSFYRDALPQGWTVYEPPPFSRSATIASRVEALRSTVDRMGGGLTLAGHSMGAALAVAVALEQPDRIERLLLIAPAGLPLTKPLAASFRDFCGQVRDRVYKPGDVVRGVAGALAAPRSAMALARAVHGLDLRPQLAAVRRLGIPCDVVGCVGDTLTPVSHCRRIAELAGGRYREIDAHGGHMWMLIEPAAFASIA